MHKLLLEQRADPCVYRHTDGTYYFTASVPEYDLIELRRADSLEGLSTAKPKTIWRKHASGAMSVNIWAPEIHFVDGRWMIYFAAAKAATDTERYGEHRIYALENDSPDPMEGTFVEKGQIDTGWESFALDSTTFVSGGQRYFVWAQRDEAIEGNSNLYIAKMKDAVTLSLPAVRLSIPEYDWERQGYLVNEGPSVLRHGGKLYLTYSGSATDERYCMGLLTAKEGSDLLDPKSWHKSPKPVMVTDEKKGLYGPGHNSFTTDEQGRDVLVFHARPYPGFHGTALGDPNRHAYIQLVEYDAQDEPVFECL